VFHFTHAEVIRMGKSARPRPARLAEKLLTIRKSLGLSQNGMIRRLELEDMLDQQYISKYERAALEPPLFVLCAYADVVNVTLDCLARDSLDLPLKIPSSTKSSGVPRLKTPSGKQRKKA
jgi:transcriptional regulator with XRE-family HTH domain